MKTIKILVVEGPAGSGKTYLINSLVDHVKALAGIDLLKVPMPFDFSPPRAYGDTPSAIQDFGTAMAYAKDMARLASLAAFEYAVLPSPHDRENEIVYVMDRWLISTLVYGRIRAGLNIDTYHRESRSFLSTLLSMPKFIAGYQSRYPKTLLEQQFEEVRIELLFAVNLPKVELIESRRASCTREFPYKADLELSTYQDCVSNLISHYETSAMVDQTARANFLVIGDELSDGSVHQLLTWLQK